MKCAVNISSGCKKAVSFEMETSKGMEIISVIYQEIPQPVQQQHILLCWQSLTSTAWKGCDLESCSYSRKCSVSHLQHPLGNRQNCSLKTGSYLLFSASEMTSDC